MYRSQTVKFFIQTVASKITQPSELLSEVDVWQNLK